MNPRYISFCRGGSSLFLDVVDFRMNREGRRSLCCCDLLRKMVMFCCMFLEARTPSFTSPAAGKVGSGRLLRTRPN